MYCSRSSYDGCSWLVHLAGDGGGSAGGSGGDCGVAAVDGRLHAGGECEAGRCFQCSTVCVVTHHRTHMHAWL